MLDAMKSILLEINHDMKMASGGISPNEREMLAQAGKKINTSLWKTLFSCYPENKAKHISDLRDCRGIHYYLTPKVAGKVLNIIQMQRRTIVLSGAWIKLGNPALWKDMETKGIIIMHTVFNNMLKVQQRRNLNMKHRKMISASHLLSLF